MNISNLQVGKLYKNYRELCSTIEEEIKDGTSKTAQIRKWSYEFKWERIGHAYKILEIYPIPLYPTVQRRRKSKYSEAIYPIIIHELYKHSIAEIPSLSYVDKKSNLFRAFGFANNLYPIINWNNNKKVEEHSIFLMAQLDCRVVLNQIFNRTLENLNRNNLISCRTHYYVKDFNSRHGDTIITNADQDVIIESNIASIISDMGLRDMFQVFSQDRYQELINKLNERLMKFHKLYYVSKAYEFSLPQDSKPISEIHYELFQDKSNEEIDDIIYENKRTVNRYIIPLIRAQNRTSLKLFNTKCHMQDTSEWKIIELIKLQYGEYLDEPLIIQTYESKKKKFTEQLIII